MCNSNNNKYWKFKDIEVEGFTYRLYNEELCSADFVLCLESSIKIHKLIEKYNYKVFYITTKPKTNLKIKFDSNKKLDLENEEVKKIKFYQSNDLFFAYMNLFFEIIYVTPHINDDLNYYYDMLLVVKNDFDIEKITKHNFNLIKIEKSLEVKKEEINFKFFENFFKNRSKLNDWTLPFKDCKNMFIEYNLSHEDFIKTYTNGNPHYDINYYHNVNSFHCEKNFNQNFYVHMYFRCLCTNIWDFGKNFYIEENKLGRALKYDDLYESIGPFFSNFGELINAKSVSFDDNKKIKFNDLEHYVCTIAENEYQLDIQSGSLSKEFVLNGFINVNNKEVRVSYNEKKTSIDNIII